MIVNEKCMSMIKLIWYIGQGGIRHDCHIYVKDYSGIVSWSMILGKWVSRELGMHAKWVIQGRGQSGIEYNSKEKV